MKSSNNLILVVDDSPDDFFIIEKSFEKAELTNKLFYVDDGEKAIDYLFNQNEYSDTAQYHKPSIVLLDLNMPRIDGKEVLEVLRTDSRTATIPIVVFSTSDDPLDIEDCYKLGASGYIKKPVGFDGFIKAISSLNEYWFEVNLLSKT